MTSRKVFAVMAMLGLLAINSIASAGIVDPAQSWAVMNNAPGIMTVAPGGEDSFVFPNDHLITVYVNDSGGNPVEILASDIWLEEPGVVWCPGGVIADSSTYAPDPGVTTFSSTPRGGCYFEAGHDPAIDGLYDCSTITMNVIAVGNEIQSLELQINGPDFNGDGAVNPADFGMFAAQYNDFVDAWPCANFDESDPAVLPTCGVADFAIYATFHNLSECP